MVIIDHKRSAICQLISAEILLADIQYNDRKEDQHFSTDNSLRQHISEISKPANFSRNDSVSRYSVN